MSLISLYPPALLPCRHHAALLLFGLTPAGCSDASVALRNHFSSGTLYAKAADMKTVRRTGLKRRAALVLQCLTQDDQRTGTAFDAIWLWLVCRRCAPCSSGGWCAAAGLSAAGVSAAGGVRAGGSACGQGPSCPAGQPAKFRAAGRAGNGAGAGMVICAPVYSHHGRISRIVKDLTHDVLLLAG